MMEWKPVPAGFDTEEGHSVRKPLVAKYPATPWFANVAIEGDYPLIIGFYATCEEAMAAVEAWRS